MGNDRKVLAAEDMGLAELSDCLFSWLVFLIIFRLLADAAVVFKPGYSGGDCLRL